jgi:hypothetical protein
MPGDREELPAMAVAANNTVYKERVKTLSETLNIESILALKDFNVKVRKNGKKRPVQGVLIIALQGKLHLAIIRAMKAVVSSLLFIPLALAVVFLPREVMAVSQNPFFYFLEGEFLGGYSEIESKDGTGSILSRWMASPNWKLNDKLFWINVYDGSYNRQSQVVTQDEGGQQVQSTQHHSISSALRFNVNESWSLRPLFFADWVFVNETEDEDFGDGLYDYRDIGGGIESAWTLQKTKTRLDELRAGFRFFDREYPNFQSLSFLFDPNGSPEVNEKDFAGYKWNLSFDSQTRENCAWGVEAIFLYKDYDDKRTIDENGIRLDDTRQDYLQYLNAYFSRPLNSQWRWRVDGQFIFNTSNLDYYDTHNTISLVDDNFIKNYYDYFAFLVRPSLTYTHAVAKDKDMSLSFGYTFYALHYPGRKAQDAGGIYGGEDQQDFAHTFSARFSYPITKEFSWVASASYTVAESNQDFEEFYLYSYNLWSALTGISFRY